MKEFAVNILGQGGQVDFYVQANSLKVGQFLVHNGMNYIVTKSWLNAGSANQTGGAQVVFVPNN